eukprot:2425357-Pleurochrysis_carterae.AAC.2
MAEFTVTLIRTYANSDSITRDTLVRLSTCYFCGRRCHRRGAALTRDSAADSGQPRGRPDVG